MKKMRGEGSRVNSICFLTRLIALGASVSLATHAHPCRACLNDTSVDYAEKEFRSRYDAPDQNYESVARSYNLWGIAALSIGAGLIGGCVFVELGRRARGGP